MLWHRHPPRKRASTHYAREFQIRELTAQILLNRGLNGLEVMRGFLKPEFDELHEPFLMKDMEKAVRRIRRAIVRRERIHVHGDYDVDGITATAVIMEGLRAAGADVHYHIINRNDASVGLSVKSLDRDHLPHGPKLIITADCGTSSLEGIRKAKDAGVDVIVVDHHMPGPRLPRCAALLNPMQPRCEFPFKGLAAVGVAFNLVLGLDRFLSTAEEGWPRLGIERMTDLVALGTISDLVPLVDENRIFVRAGMERLRSARRPGICALMRSARLLRSNFEPAHANAITARTVGYRLAPLLNAAGRMDDANQCVDLLIADNFRVADKITSDLQAFNSQRQAAEKDVLTQAVAQAEEMVGREAPALVLVDGTWHPGVLGIVASRLVERYNRPALVAAIDDSGMAKGSIRAPDGIDMLQVLYDTRDLLDTWGGHKVAAGVAFKAEYELELRRRVEAGVAEQTGHDAVPERTVHVDGVIGFDAITPSLIDELESLAPFGAANPEPVFEARRVQPIQARIVNGSNARVRLRQGSVILDAYGYGLGKRVGELRKAVDIVFTPRIVRGNGPAQVELVLRDFSEAR